MKRIPVFGTDEARACTVPTVARLPMTGEPDRFCVVGTAYGYWHTSGGDIRTWRTPSGARKAAARYVPL